MSTKNILGAWLARLYGAIAGFVFGHAQPTDAEPPREHDVLAALRLLPQRATVNFFMNADGELTSDHECRRIACLVAHYPVLPIAAALSKAPGVDCATMRHMIAALNVPEDLVEVTEAAAGLTSLRARSQVAQRIASERAASLLWGDAACGPHVAAVSLPASGPAQVASPAQVAARAMDYGQHPLGVDDVDDLGRQLHLMREAMDGLIQARPGKGDVKEPQVDVFHTLRTLSDVGLEKIFSDGVLAQNIVVRTLLDESIFGYGLFGAPTERALAVGALRWSPQLHKAVWDELQHAIAAQEKAEASVAQAGRTQRLDLATAIDASLDVLARHIAATQDEPNALAYTEIDRFPPQRCAHLAARLRTRVLRLQRATASVYTPLPAGAAADAAQLRELSAAGHATGANADVWLNALGRLCAHLPYCPSADAGEVLRALVYGMASDSQPVRGLPSNSEGHGPAWPAPGPLRWAALSDAQRHRAMQLVTGWAHAGMAAIMLTLLCGDRVTDLSAQLTHHGFCAKEAHAWASLNGAWQRLSQRQRRIAASTLFVAAEHAPSTADEHATVHTPQAPQPHLFATAVVLLGAAPEVASWQSALESLGVGQLSDVCHVAYLCQDGMFADDALDLDRPAEHIAALLLGLVTNAVLTPGPEVSRPAAPPVRLAVGRLQQQQLDAMVAAPNWEAATERARNWARLCMLCPPNMSALQAAWSKLNQRMHAQGVVSLIELDARGPRPGPAVATPTWCGGEGRAGPVVATASFKAAYSQLAILTAAGVPTLIMGPTGAGKSLCIRHLFEQTVACRAGGGARPQLIPLALSRHTTADDFLGRYELNRAGQASWRNSPLVDAMRRGDWVVFDNINLVDPNVLVTLHTLFEGDRTLAASLPRPCIIRAHPNFRALATANAPTQAAGRRRLSDALTSRLTTIVMPHPSPPELAQILNTLHAARTVPQNLLSDLVRAHVALCRAAQSDAGGQSGDAPPPFTIRRLQAACSALARAGGPGGPDLKLLRRTVAEHYLAEHHSAEHLQPLADALRTTFGTSTEDGEDGGNALRVFDVGHALMVGDVELKKYHGGGPRVPGADCRFVWTPRLVHVLRHLAHAIADRRNALLVGEPGCGKTSLVRMLAHLLGRPFEHQTCHGDTGPIQLLGQQTIDGWQDGPLLAGQRPGGVPSILLLDEINYAPPGSLEWMNSALGEMRHLTAPELGAQGVPMRPDFVVVAAMNPPSGNGTGGTALASPFADLWQHIAVPSPEPDEARAIVRELARQRGLSDTVATAWLERMAQATLGEDSVAHAGLREACAGIALLDHAVLQAGPEMALQRVADIVLRQGRPEAGADAGAATDPGDPG